MSSGKRVVLIIATILVIGGSAISFGAFAAAGFNFQNLSTEARNWAPVTKTFEPEAEAAHTAIIVNDGGENVRIEASDGDAIEVTYWTNDNKTFDIADNGGVLSIEGSREPMIGVMMIGSFEDHTTVVKVPRSYAGSLEVGVSSGNIAINNLGTLTSVKATTASGYIDVARFEADSVVMQVTSGNVQASNIKATYVDATAMSGSVNLDDVEADETVKLDTTSGNQRMRGVSALSIDAHIASGNIDANGIAADYVKLDATSGNLTASFAGADTDYVIEASATSGNVSAPAGNATATKHVIAHSMSGNVTLSFASGGPNITSGSNAPEAPEPPEAPEAPEAPVM